MSEDTPKVEIGLKRVSYFEETLEYHQKAGSSPPEILINNPGKTRAELMTDEEILKRLKRMDELVANDKQRIAEDPSLENSAIGQYLKIMEEG